MVSLPQRGIDTMSGKKAFMGAPLDDFALFQDKDLLGLCNGVQPVGTTRTVHP